MHTIHNFKLIDQRTIPERKSEAFLYEHITTGARLICIENDDENKVFSIGFATPVSDSTGVPHILEHSVLCGSRKYPVKEPFVELVKGSLNTFLNAMTFPDKTVYPVASQNAQDFYNLVDVYLDAVFFPNITPDTLQQEGWHYELTNLTEPLTYKGVVYNEMRGSYSDPDRELYETSLASIFPDVPTYALDSGGDPSIIPTLTYDQFKRFYDSMYQPSNAYIYFYGDDRSDERFRILDGYLSQFNKSSELPSIVPQPHFNQPKTIVRKFEAPSSDKNHPKGMAMVNWLFGSATNLLEKMELMVLGYILLGTPASPLYKALIDSGLGEDVFGGTPDLNPGMYDAAIQHFMGVGLKGVEPANLTKVEKVIFDTLTQLADHGVSKSTVESSLNTIEFLLRENEPEGYPRGLGLNFELLGTWLYGGNPLEALFFEDRFTQVKNNILNDSGYVGQLIYSYLLDNTHRTTVILEPDGSLKDHMNKEAVAILESVKEKMNEAELQEIITNTERLMKLQSAPDSLDALASIPTLHKSNLPLDNKVIPLEKQSIENITLLTHDIFTNDIAYVELGFDMSGISQDLLPLVPLYARCLTEMGTQSKNFVELSEAIGRSTGGIDTSLYISAKPDYAPQISSIPSNNDIISYLFVQGKTTIEHTGEFFSLVQEILKEPNFDNKERFKQMLLDEKSSIESSLASSGHAHANRQLKAALSPDGWVAEQMYGLSNLAYLQKISSDFETHWNEILPSLSKLHEQLIQKSNLICNITTEGKDTPKVIEELTNFIQTMPDDKPIMHTWKYSLNTQNEGFVIPAQVNYVGQGVDLYDVGYEYTGADIVILNFLRTSYLWEKVRVLGGAYGAMCRLDKFSGVFNLLSYRDPNVLKTLQTYDEVASFLQKVTIDESELTKNIIGAIGEMDDYLLPSEKGYASLLRYILGETNENRQRTREQVLNASEADFHKFGEALAQANMNSIIKALGSKTALEQANLDKPGLLEIREVL